MNVTNFTINEKSITWTSAHSSGVSFVFVNGQFVHGPILFNSVNRSLPLILSKIKCSIVEVHDFEDVAQLTQSHTIKRKHKPTILWDGVEGVALYSVHHRIVGGTFEVLEKIPHTYITQYHYTSKISLSEGIHYFKVEAVDKFGNESMRNEWAYTIPPFPKPAQSLTLSDGSASGLFNLNVVE